MMRLACALLVLAACGRKTGELQLVEIKRGELIVGVAIAGELRAIDSTDIKPPPVPVQMWNFKIASMAPEGADVKVGDPIVGFDAMDFIKDLETMQNEADAAKKQIDKKRDDAALARREEELAIADAEAALRRATLKAETPPDLTASLDVQIAKLDEKSARLALELARNKAVQAKRKDDAELATLRDKLADATRRVQLLQQSIAKMEIRAPRAGTIVYPTEEWGGGQKKKVGDSVWRLETALQVVSLDKMIGEGKVDEVDMAKIAAKQPVAIQLDALPDVQLRGRIDSIARSLQQKSESDPSKVASVKLSLDPTKAPLRPGMRFRGEIEVERVPNVVLIPSDAVFVTPAGPVAYRMRDRDVERVPIGLGRRSATAIEVTSGLQPGDRVSRTDPARRNP